MKYPAILRNILGNQTVLAVSAKLFVHMSGEFELEDSESYSFDSHYTDITQEYLSNTWGVVESKEHAQFIIKLAELHGFEFLESSTDNKNFFHIGGECFALLTYEPTHRTGCKQITIPLPPKAKEWLPEVGDTVTWGNKVCNGVVKAVDGNLAWIKNDHANYVTEYIDNLVKPKSKQELLIEELQTKLCNNNAVDNYILACDVINGDIEGLSYKV